MLKFACAMALCFCLRGAGSARSQEIWFGPRGPDVRPGAAADWDALFKPTPDWAAVASKIDVFPLTAGYIVEAPDADLKAAAVDLDKRHIAIAIGLQSIGIGSGDLCGHEEGYGQPAISAQAAAKLNRLGISLRYLQLDEPVWFGHYESGPEGCKLTIPDLARRVALNVREYQRFFPDVVVGDIEPVPLLMTLPDWQTTFVSFVAEMHQVLGRPLQFLQTDVNWRIPSSRTALLGLRTFAHGIGLKFGVIYNGDGGDATAAAWVADAIDHFELVESGDGLIPEQALIGTWDQQPTHIFPASSNETLSYVLARYRLPRTDISAVRSGRVVTGRLTDDSERPVPHADVALRTVGMDLHQPPAVHVAAGLVPPKARYAIIGMRINTECLCAGANDLLVGDLRYAETAGGTVIQPYDLTQEVRPWAGKAWNGAGVTLVRIGSQDFARLVVRADQHFGFNSPMFSVTPGARFVFAVPLASVDGSGMFGQATVIWFDEAKQGLERTDLFLGAERPVVATAPTDEGGNFTFRLAPPIASEKVGLDVTFAGSDRWRATDARVE